MNIANLQSDLWSLAPELWLVALGLLVLLADLVVPAGRKAAVGLIAVVGLVLALIPTSSMVLWQARSVLFGTYAVDGFAVFLKIIAISTTVLVILSPWSRWAGRLVLKVNSTPCSCSPRLG